MERVGALGLGLGSVMAEIGVEAGRLFERLEVEEVIIIFHFLFLANLFSTPFNIKTALPIKKKKGEMAAFFKKISVWGLKNICNNIQ